MRLYKLTDQNGKTQNNTQWGPRITHSVTPCHNPKLCTSQVIHAYTNVNLAFLLNPSHANISDPRLWLAEGKIAVKDWGKAGTFSLTAQKELDIPAWVNSDKASDVRVMFAILCAETVLGQYEKWNSGDDRPRKAIQVAREYLKTKTGDAVRVAADAAADAAAYAAADAADAAAYAAYAAADAAAYAARAAAYAARAVRAVRAVRVAADAAADAAAYAAADAARAAEIDFGKLADKAVKLIMKH